MKSFKELIQLPPINRPVGPQQTRSELVESAKHTVAAHVDRPIMWDAEDGGSRTVFPKDAQIYTNKEDAFDEDKAGVFLDPDDPDLKDLAEKRRSFKKDNGMYQGVLFPPETVAEHWVSPERVNAVNKFLVKGGDQFARKDVLHHIQMSLIPNALLEKLANRGELSVDPKIESRGKYSFDNKNITLNVGLNDKGLSTTLSHEFGHMAHHGLIEEEGHSLTEQITRNPNSEDIKPNTSSREIGWGADPHLEGVAQGFAFRYSHHAYPVSSYETLKDEQWGAPGGREVFKTSKDSVADKGVIPEFLGLNHKILGMDHPFKTAERYRRALIQQKEPRQPIKGVLNQLQLPGFEG